MKYFLFLTGYLLCMAPFLHAQDFTNKGKDFWVGYGNHVRMMSSGTPETMQLYITSDVNTSGQVSIAGVAGFPKNFTVTANRITTIDIPRSAALMDEGLFNTGIHITAQKPVVVYSFIYVNAISGATLCLPTNTLGREYYSVNYDQVSNEPQASFSYFFAVAADTGTTVVEIVPAKTTRSGKPAGVPFTVSLQQGQAYQVLSSADLTGSTIRSINTGSGCKRLAVFSGSGKISIGCSNAATSDNLYQQMYPTATWGKTYVTVPSINKPSLRSQQNYYRIVKSSPTAQVWLNGSLIPAGNFVNGLYTTINSTGTPHYITADQPVMVAQYFTSQQCDNNTGMGDPDMIFLNPVEQTVTRVTLNSMQPSFNTNLNEHYLNVVIKNDPAATGSFKIDGVASGSYFKPHPNAPGFAYAQIPVAAGTHTLTCDTAFNAIAYGFGQAESYGYSAGTNLKDLYQFVSVKNNYASVDFPAGCAGSPFRFSMTFPYEPTRITWKFNGLFPDSTIQNPAYDSSWVVNGRTLYRYPLDAMYTIAASGVYPISVQAQNLTATGCNSEQLIEYDLEIFERPAASFTHSYSGCANDSIEFFDNTNGLGRPVTRWYWDFNGQAISNLANPKYQFPSQGTYTVQHAVITDIGCLSDTVSTIITTTDPPVANFSFSDTACEAATVRFSDQSVPTNGTLVSAIWDFGDGTVQSVAAGNVVTDHIYKQPGIYQVSLIAVNSLGCKSEPVSKSITVQHNPVPDFALPGNVCLPFEKADFTNLTTIADGTQSQLTYHWDFGDGATASETSPAHLYTGTGPFTISLTATSIHGCVADTSMLLKSVHAQPKADFSGHPSEVCLGEDIRFTSQSDGRGGTITQWNWSFDDGNTGTRQEESHTYATADTFSVALFVVTGDGCFSDTITKKAVVHPLPEAGFTWDSPTCEKGDIAFHDQSVAHAGTVTQWTWGLLNSRTSPLQDPVFSFDVAGDYTISLIVRTDKGCISEKKEKLVTVHHLPQPDFGAMDICSDDPYAVFSDSSSIDDGSEAQFGYQWQFGDGSPISVQKNPQHHFPGAAMYNITLTVTSKDGCVADTTRSFTVNGAQPKAAFSIPGENALCAGQEMQLRDQSGINFGNIIRLEIYWDYRNDPTDKTVVNSPVPGAVYQHVFAGSGSASSKDYEIRYVVYSGVACVDQAVKSVTVKASPDIIFNQPVPVCEEVVPYPLTDARELLGLPGTGTYSGNGVLGGNIFNPSFAGPGVHNIEYRYVANNGCAAAEGKGLKVHPSPEADAGPDRVMLEGGTIRLAARASGFLPSYSWSPGTGIADSTVLQPVLSPAIDMTYTLTVRSQDGCIARDAVSVTILKKVVIPNVFSPNGDGINDTWVIQYLETYPGCTIDVFNRYGQKVYHSTGYGRPWDGTFNGKALPVGTYYYIIHPRNGREPLQGSVTLLK